MKRSLLLLIAVLISFVSLQRANAAALDEMSLKQYAKLREVERYQMKIADKYYHERNYKVAMAEYEKFLTLYERSIGAPYAQLRWSICLVHQRKLNTAIKEGFQSVVDYWPESNEAIAADYYIAKTYKDMGEVRKAKKTYQSVLDDHPKHLAAVYTCSDLIEIAKVQKDSDLLVKMWKQLTFETPRNRESKSLCQRASYELASYQFYQAALKEGLEALKTTYSEEQLAYYVLYYSRRPISTMAADSKTKAKAEKFADECIAYIRSVTPKNTSEEEDELIALNNGYYIGDIHIAAGRDTKVVPYYQEMMKQFGERDTIRDKIATYFKSKNKYDEARAQYRQYKNKVEGNSQIAYSYRQQKNYDPAVLAYRQNVVLDPDQAVHWNSTIATTYREASKYKEAVAVYEELYKTDSKNAEKWIWQIATTYRDAGEHKQAIAYYRQSNNFPSNYSEMAACHRRLKEYKEAIILYNQIIGGAPKSAAWALYEVARTQEAAGNKEKAILTFQQVCKRFPKDSYASRAHAHLQNTYKITVTLGGAKDE
ncbi:MAG: hypothetical protein CMJ78_08760 [Planctomycetaceae bacterium]|nr:hypothetical protein [Planctomycetaceae bacterium]